MIPGGLAPTHGGRTISRNLGARQHASPLVCKRHLLSLSPAEAAELIQTMQRNRIESTAAMDHLLRLAETNEALLPSAMAQLVKLPIVPRNAETLYAR